MSKMKAKHNVDYCGGSRLTREITSISQKPLAFLPLSLMAARRAWLACLRHAWAPVSPAAVAPTHWHLLLVHSSSLQVAPKFTRPPSAM